MTPALSILVAIFVPILAGAVAWPTLRKRAAGKDPKAYVAVVLAAAFAASAAAAWLSLPHLFHLSPIDRVLDDVSHPPVLARMVLEQHEALLRTTEVLHWWAFSLFIVFMNASIALPSMLRRMTESASLSRMPESAAK